jgi:putative ABC transport system substrate-binding protein
MRRRDFVTVLAGAAAYPLLAGAQQKPTPVIGILAAAAPDNAGALRMLAAFREGLGEFAYVEGQNAAIEYRWAEAHFDRLPTLAADLVARKVDVIVTEGGDGSVLAAKQATSTIPVVFHANSDPVAMGLVASLARPGGNLTGVSLHGLAAKRIELASELASRAKAIALLVNPNDPSADADIRDAQEAARAKGAHARPFRRLDIRATSPTPAACSAMARTLRPSIT